MARQEQDPDFAISIEVPDLLEILDTSRWETREFVLPDPNDDPVLDELDDLIPDVKADPFEVTREPRWRDESTPQSREFIPKEEPIVADASCARVEFDPGSPTSILRAAASLASPLARAAGTRFVEFAVPEPHQNPITRPVPLPAGPPPANTRDALLRASGLPEGPIIPDELKEAVDRAIDTIVEHKPQLVFGTAATVAAAIAITTVPGLSPDQADIANALRNRPVAEAQARPASKKPEPISAKLISADVAYVPSRPTHLRAIANDLKIPLQTLVASNPGISIAQEIPAGTKIGGVAPSSSVTLPGPVSVSKLAAAYGLTDDAVRSVNTVTEHGLVVGQAIIPGRQIIDTGAQFDADTQAIASHLGLGETGTRELARVNSAAPAGQIVLPLVTNDPEKLPDALAVAQVAAGGQLPAEPSSPTAPKTPDGQVPVSSTTSTTKPEDGETGSSTTTSTPAGSGPGDKPPVEETTTTLAAASPSAVPEEPATVPAAETEPTTTTTTAPPPPPPPVEKHYRPALPEEKFAAEQAALKSALDTALQSGDMGPLNHLITYSPIFKAYDLPADMQNQGFRYLPDAAALGIDGLVYEYSPDTPSKERVANTQIIALNLLAAYSYRAEIQANPLYTAAFGSSCIRFGDLSAHEGHKSHNGAQSDITSSMQCNMRDGHGSADGPIFWINKSEGDIDRRVANPHYNLELERKILERLLNARIDGQPLLHSILFNAPNLGLSGVQVYPNHNNHIHINGAGPGNARLKVISEGGIRPELKPDQLRAMWYLAYSGGDGVVGISKDMQVEVTLEQFQQLSAALDAAKAQQAQAAANPPVAQPDPAATPAPVDPAPAPAASAPADIDYMSVLPLQSDIPAEFVNLFHPSKHFSSIELAAQVWTESKFNPNARSGVGAQGLTQFMPGTWRTWGKDDPNDPDNTASPFNPVEALDAQRRLMDQNYEEVQRLLDQGKIKGNVRELAYAAYNAGLGNVMDYDGIPPFKETRGYIKRINEKIEFYVKAVAQEHGVQ